MLFALLGTPKDAAEFHAALTRIIEREERIAWLMQSAKTGAGWFVAIGAAVIMVRDILPILLRALTGAP